MHSSTASHLGRAANSRGGSTAPHPSRARSSGSLVVARASQRERKDDANAKRRACKPAWSRHGGDMVRSAMASNVADAALRCTPRARCCDALRTLRDLTLTLPPLSPFVAASHYDVLGIDVDATEDEVRVRFSTRQRLVVGFCAIAWRRSTSSPQRTRAHTHDNDNNNDTQNRPPSAGAPRSCTPTSTRQTAPAPPSWPQRRRTRP